MKKLVFIIFLSFIGCSNKNNKQDNLSIKPEIDTLKFSSRGFNQGHYLKLLSDSSFIDEKGWSGCLGGGEITTVYGTYKGENGKTILNPKKVIVRELPIFRNDTTTKITKYKYHPDSLKFKTEYFLINWKNSMYLLSENVAGIPQSKSDFMSFAQYFNSESRGFKFDGFLYLDNEKINDSLRTAFDYNQIPFKWKKYFLKYPIVSKIIKVELLEKDSNEGGFYRIEINKGAKDSIYDGLYFSNKENSMFIDSTFTNKSFTTIYLSNDESPKELIGSIIKTKW